MVLNTSLSERVAWDEISFWFTNHARNTESQHWKRPPVIWFRQTRMNVFGPALHFPPLRLAVLRSVPVLSKWEFPKQALKRTRRTRGEGWQSGHWPVFQLACLHRFLRQGEECWKGRCTQRGFVPERQLFANPALQKHFLVTRELLTRVQLVIHNSPGAAAWPALLVFAFGVCLSVHWQSLLAWHYLQI